MNRYLDRRKVYERVEPSKDSKKVFIFGEGQDREYKYFMYFQYLSSNINIIPVPCENGKSNPSHLIEYAEKCFSGSSPKFHFDENQNDEVWFVIDTDEWNDQIPMLKNSCSNKNSGKQYSLWNVAQSNPCFEIWLYYHFFDKKPDENEVEECDSFKDFVNRKVPGGFDSRTMPAMIETAIKNSKSTYSEKDNQPELYCTELFNLGDKIMPFIKLPITKIMEKTKQEFAKFNCDLSGMKTGQVDRIPELPF